ncbi:sulfatase/phosphatase domain-containing protein, partial [Algoriphagus sp.]|uniref:sulfatase/phosphatase domain-containing protein n=1 Tax=Algoriphagus sp. TaxID=1872435 RepID=UPI0025E13FED
SPSSWQGTSLRSKDLAKRKEFLTEHLWQVDIIAPSEAIRTERWKYFRYINDPSHEELYDLKADPLEINNLAKESAHQAILKELRGKMEKKIAEYLNDRIE